MMKYIGKKLPFIQLKKKNAKKKCKVHFEITLYFMKLNFYFNDFYAVVKTCKLELHDSG